MAAYSMSPSSAFKGLPARLVMVRQHSHSCVFQPPTHSGGSHQPLHLLTPADGCIAGTPEVMTLVYKAVQRGYAVIAISAHRGGDKWRCYETHWPPEGHHEISGVST